MQLNEDYRKVLFKGNVSCTLTGLYLYSEGFTGIFLHDSQLNRLFLYLSFMQPLQFSLCIKQTIFKDPMS